MTTQSMKKSVFARILALSLLFVMLFLAVSCGLERTGAWENAIYNKDKTLGKGEKTITVSVTAEEKTVVFTLHTDAEFLEEALVENDLVEGEESAYGLYIKYVNGIRADYTLDGGYYWSLTVNGEYADYGVGSAAVTDGAVFGLVRRK